MTGAAPEPRDAPRPVGRYWRAHLVLLALIAIPMTLFLAAYRMLTLHFPALGVRLLPVFLVSGLLAWLLRER